MSKIFKSVFLSIKYIFVEQKRKIWGVGGNFLFYLMTLSPLDCVRLSLTAYSFEYKTERRKSLGLDPFQWQHLP